MTARTPDANMISVSFSAGKSAGANCGGTNDPSSLSSSHSKESASTAATVVVFPSTVITCCTKRAPWL